MLENAELRGWYAEFDRLLNEVKDLTGKLAASNLPRQEKMRVLLFFQEFSEGIQTDLQEKHGLTEPFPTCLNCGEPIQAPFPAIEKEVTCKKCNAKNNVIYTANRVQKDKLKPDANPTIRKEEGSSIDPLNDPLAPELSNADFIETLYSLVDIGFLKVAETERMPTGLVKKYYDVTEKFRRWRRSH